MHGSLNARDLLRNELAQREEGGYDIDKVRLALDALGGVESVPEDEIDHFSDELEHTERRSDWAYLEPEDLAEIRAESAWHTGGDPIELDESYAEAVTRAWRGRIVGNMLGKPVEGFSRQTIEKLLRDRQAWPLSDFFPAPADEADASSYVECWNETTLGHIDGSSRDDDVDYTIVNLHVLRSFGPGFTTDHVAATWLELLPYLQMFTAERVAVRNIVRGDPPHEAASRRNPYREFIGAAIRADVFGYVAPGDPELAAELAYRDAVLSHRANGVYSEMWCAALIASAFTAADSAEAFDSALHVVPRRSRLHEALSDVRAWHREGRTWEDVRDGIERAWGGYSWVHAIPNAAVVAAGVLFGDGEFGRTITHTVSAGLDTDSNGGTAGSVGAILADRIDASWTDPIHDAVRSAVFGYDNSSVATLAGYTVEVAAGIRANSDDPACPRNAIPRRLW